MRAPQSNSLKPRVYLAGKVAKNGWRHQLVGGLREHSWDDGALAQPTFTYTGPFFISCDHGCFHATSSHGVYIDYSSESDMSKRELIALCKAGVAKADILFCYIETHDCYGTLAEIVWAQERGIPVVIAFAPGVAHPDHNEFYFLCEDAVCVRFDIKVEDLPDLFESCLLRYGP